MTSQTHPIDEKGLPPDCFEFKGKVYRRGDFVRLVGGGRRREIVHVAKGPLIAAPASTWPQATTPTDQAELEKWQFLNNMIDRCRRDAAEATARAEAADARLREAEEAATEALHFITDIDNAHPVVRKLRVFLSEHRS
jgi:hypothetical protein